MDLLQLRCFISVAESLHFGRAAQQLDMLPASLSRHIRLLEEELGTTLIRRTTRHVVLTEAGVELLEEARGIVGRAEMFLDHARTLRSAAGHHLRVGAIDSAAAGLMPELLHYFREDHPEIQVELLEQKTIRLVPKLVSGGLDLAFIRPPDVKNPKLIFRPLFSETAVVAIPEAHPLAHVERLTIEDLADQPLIVPDRGSRPHSHDLTIKLFLEAGMTARVAQIAEEKQTIVSIVAAGLGLAIVPRWTARLQVSGVRFVPIDLSQSAVRDKLALAVTWVRGTHDPLRDALLETLDRNLDHIAQTA